MAVVFVKITDLNEALLSDVSDSDYFLQASPMVSLDDADASSDVQYISRTACISSFINYITSQERNVTGHWRFTAVKEPPEQNTRFSITDYVNNILLKKDNRSNCINLTGNGYYSDNPTLFPHSPTATKSSLSVSQYSIANLDYVNRVFANVFDSLINELAGAYNREFGMLGGKRYIRSSVGDFVFSTTKSLSSEAQLQAIYGDGQVLYTIGGQQIRAPLTRWKKHGEYVLRGASSGVEANKDSSSDGSNNNLLEIPLPTHGHTLSKHTHGGVKVKAWVDGGKWVTDIWTGDEKMKDDSHAKYHRKALQGVSKGNVKVAAEASLTIGSSKNFNCSYVGTDNKVSKIQPTFYCWVWERTQ